jgi:hypothetical protein
LLGVFFCHLAVLLVFLSAVPIVYMPFTLQGCGARA